ncbi:MAG TPA: pilus assembly protein PilM, partial [Kofleriaceae bacterium]
PGDEPAEVRARAVLAQLLIELRLRDDPGYLGVFGDQVFTQILEFPFKNLRRADLDKAVGGELEGVVPVDLEDMVYTFEALPPTPVLPGAELGPDGLPLPGLGLGPTGEPVRGRVAPPVDGMRVLTYAMRRERVESLIELGRSVGFEPRGVLTAAGSAIRLVAAAPSLAAARGQGAVAVIDIGHERTDVVVVAGGKAVFSRSLARAGRQVTEAIARHWQFAWKDAEDAKHTEGFVASHAEPATSEAWQRIHLVTIAELQPFARDLRQTLAACRARTGFQPVAALLVGGGSRLRGIASFLSEQLAIPAWRFTAEDVAAIAGIKLASESMAARLPIDTAAMTIGMAFDAAGGRPLFDLRSGALAVKVDLSFLRAKAMPLGVAALVIAGFAAFSAYADLYRLRKEERILTTRVAEESQEVLGEAKTAKQILDTTSGPGGHAASPLPKATAYDLLIDISGHVPGKDKIQLDLEHITIDEAKVDLSGTTKTSEEIDLLITELKKIDCFKDNLTRGATETLPNGNKRFKLTVASTCLGGT